MRKEGPGVWLKFLRWLGERLVIFAPWLMKFLTVVGTIAMFMVGGGILVHGIHVLDVVIRSLVSHVNEIATVGPVVALLTPTIASIGIGMVAGAVVLGLVELWHRFQRNT
jgi:hypothetical protein